MAITRSEGPRANTRSRGLRWERGRVVRARFRAQIDPRTLRLTRGPGRFNIQLARSDTAGYLRTKRPLIRSPRRATSSHFPVTMPEVRL